ncbi:nucleotidyltransferase domain-containing protein [Lachnoclostridium sp. An76]|uniref:nucleotidyltransferase domain-containing protein n=1 Tax=Lachnoclostridium sp. An76 TaxID=1965654 RepID=UPI000B3742C0|nr:nucleotidyltransferase family protein [Lachnoclostridium sp. An76]OUN34115.1 hypothetical protein B5G27_08540 [Lachnoclostridium sp. An76]
MNNTQIYLLTLVRCALGEKNLPTELRSLSTDEKIEIIRYAQKQGLLTFLQYFDIFMEKDCRDIFFPRAAAAVCEDVRQASEIVQLLEAFEKNGIYCIPLKGIRTKKLYPSSELRTMGDLDILYRKEQTDGLRRVMAEQGYTWSGEAAKHDHYEKGGRTVEMHKELLSSESRAYDYFLKIWDRAQPEEGKRYCWQMSMEDHYLFTLYHLIEHFIRGGIGIRMVLDIYILSGFPELDRDKTAEELKKLKIDRFEKNILDIAGKWFDPSRGLQGTGALSGLEEMEEYIVNGGIFGNTVNEQANNALRYGSRGKFLKSVIFPSYKTMQSVFPDLDSPILLPAAWVRRWWNVWTKRRGNVRKQLGRAGQIGQQDSGYIEKQRRFFQRCGL